jgi:thioredoxin 1
MASIRTVTASELQALVADRPVVVDFYADWCHPCHALAPELERVASAFEGEVTVVKLDIEADPAYAQQQGVLGIPTVVHYGAGGAEVARSVGVRRAPELAQALGLGALAGA